MRKSNVLSRAKLVSITIILSLILLLTFGVFSFNKAEAAGGAVAQKYRSEYGSKKEAIIAGSKLNERIAQEGMVLLKNENHALPILTGKGTDAAKISVFGYASVKPAGGGSSEGDTSGGVVRLSSDIYSSLGDAGYIVNPMVKNLYQNWVDTGTQKDPHNSDTKFATVFNNNKALLAKTYSSYNDAAIVVLTSEAPVAKTSTVTGNHGNDVSVAQFALVEEVCKNFDRVVVLINNSKPIEINELKLNEKVDAILVIGEPGDNGLNAVGQILSGQINPSGRLTDIVPVDFTKDPTFVNYNNKLTNTDNWQYLKADGKTARNAYMVDYEEGIYIGYRYYETLSAIKDAVGGATANEWYNNNVAYSFGEGLSYTDFSWEEVTTTPANNANITKNSTITVNVKVTNTGSVAGKEVVQLYYTAPYGTETTNPTKIEKSFVALGDFAKTQILQPKESEVLTLTIKASDMASYDYKTDKTYVLDPGDYKIKLMKNSHDVVGSAVTYKVASKELCNVSTETGKTITNQFDDVNNAITARGASYITLSRANLEQALTAPTTQERTLTDEQYKDWTPIVNAAYDAAGKPWVTDKMPTVADPATRAAQAKVMLKDLIGKPYDSALWDALLDELSYDEMKTLIEKGGFQSIEIPYIGKPFVRDTDGPKGWTGSGANYNKFAAAPIIAGTFNKELAYEMGKMIGDQGLWGNNDVNVEEGGRISAYTGWYAPAINTHRSPFDTRYTEYYSEDGVLAGYMAANASLGAKSKGAYVYIKHFALHEDGGGVNFGMKPDGSFVINGYRGVMGDGGEDSGLSIWCNEQAMREIYFKPFQIAVEEGQASGAMSSFSRIGKTWAGGSHALLTDVLRDEWGFKGTVITDIAIYKFLNVDQMIRAGGDLVLHAGSVVALSDNKSATQISAMRRATKNILYTVANSNAMQMPLGAAVLYNTSALADAKANAVYTADVASAEINTVTTYSNITYKVFEGNLPDGLTLSADGKITGKPTKEGKYSFTVAAEATGYESAGVPFTITVNPEKTTSDIIGDANDDTNNKIDAIQKDLNKKIDNNNTAISGVKTLVVVSIVFGVLGLVASAGFVVLTILKKKSN